MKLISALFFISISSLNLFGQEVKTIFLQVDVLGKKHETVRYYHPVEGLYNVTLSNYQQSKKTDAQLPNFVFIDPRTHLNDSLNFIQANSLRHYIDPSELIYIEWMGGVDSLNDSMMSEIKKNARKTENKKYQQLINNYFKPFYFRKYEVTNDDYREFVFWVRDSLFKEAIYASEEFTDEEVFEMLQFDGEGYYCEGEDGGYKAYSPVDRLTNRQMFHFKQDFDLSKKFTDERIVPVISQFYLRPAGNWYKRRELDVTKLQYAYFYTDYDSLRKTPKEKDSLGNLIHSGPREFHDRSKFIVRKTVGIYPDTLRWIRDGQPYPFTDPQANLYFWHPVFRNFPVVGISYEQAKAFLHWKQQMIFNEYPELEYQFEFDLPRVYEYEWAICHLAKEDDKIIIQDNELITNLLTGYPDGDVGRFHEILRFDALFTSKNKEAFDPTNKEVQKWIRENKNEKYFAHLYMRYSQNWLPGGIEFLSNNVSEWMDEDYKTHYEKLFEAYINYNCYASIDYCEDQRNIDVRNEMRNDSTGHLIMGGNWYDERYETLMGVNVGGLYPKTFRDKDSSFATVGFRYVVRLR